MCIPVLAEKVETEVKIEAGGGAPEVVMEVKTETKKEEVKVEVQVETGGDAVAEVVVTTEETTTEVEVTAAAAEEEEKEEQPPATEGKALSIAECSTVIYIYTCALFQMQQRMIKNFLMTF